MHFRNWLTFIFTNMPYKSVCFFYLKALGVELKTKNTFAVATAYMKNKTCLSGKMKIRCTWDLYASKHVEFENKLKISCK